MKIDPDIVRQHSKRSHLKSHLRVTPLAHAATPLGMGFGKTRLACPDDTFKVLYIAPQLVTGVAETIIRDRFVEKAQRRLTEEDIETWGATEVESREALNILDLRKLAPHHLGLRTDALLAKNQAAGRRVSRAIYEQAPRVDAILYTSRLTKMNCVCVYDRAATKLHAGPVHPLINLRALTPALELLKIQVLRAPIARP
ncbi:RES domain-containing protein [Caulobacter sp. AP07]|uniref:RES family NAD+ phosphorylase n=1 Tax=Caulobacter sp. AP07 TaxID=1144304 RepID=UPI0002721180|nr:RES family NAD+ phosphorylase [Caulobacter sp. AP07]EJL27370.1 RES domain-containing protein [Caulobacter sp. AP07]